MERSGQATVRPVWTIGQVIGLSGLRRVTLHDALYAVAGILFGIVLIKGEIVSWFRVQEMFRFQSFHMYGIIGTAILTGVLSLAVLRRLKVRTVNGETLRITPRKFHTGQIYGGLMFGVGWGITGACPGPLYALIGSGYPAAIVILASAFLGTWLSGYLHRNNQHAACGD